MGWIDRPVFIDNIPLNGIDRIIFLDESGTSSLSTVLKHNCDPNVVDHSEKFFTLTACVFTLDDFHEAKELITWLKMKHWINGMYNDKGTMKRVILHSTEIRRRANAFSDSELNYPVLMSDIDYVMSELKMMILSACVDKIALCNRYFQPTEPYDLCFDFIFERLVKFALPNKNCLVILERRGKKEDHKLLSHIRQILQKGTKYVNAAQFSTIQGVYFNPKWTDDYQKSYYGLEIADLCAYSIYKQCTSPNGYAPFEIVKKHFYGYPNYLGRGLKIFP